MNKNRVVITGLGIVCPAGMSISKWWDNLLSGKSKVQRLNSIGIDDNNLKFLGAEIQDFNFKHFFEKANEYESYCDRGLQFGFIAAREAYGNAKVEEYRDRIDNDKFGIYLGTTTGGIISAYQNAKEYCLNNHDKITNNLLFSYPPGSWAGILAHYFNINGPTITVGTSCYAGGESFGLCFRDIQDDRIDIAIVGGLDAPILITNLLSFSLIGAMSKWKGEPEEACKPFSANRDGMVFGEGAGFLIMEKLEHAIKRNIKIYAEVLGYSASIDAESIVAPPRDHRKLVDTILKAIDEAGIDPREIKYVNCHGTGTKLNDKHEAKAIKEAFGEHALNLCVSSIKSMIGHSFGAAAAKEIISCVKTLETNQVPPTINFQIPDPECDIYCVPNKKKILEDCNYVLKLASGFGGTNLAIVLSKYSS